MSDQQFTLSVAYFAGKRDEIVKGQDGHRDYFTPDELERAAHTYLRKSRSVGMFHIDGTEGHGEVVESYIYRGPDWQITDTQGRQVLVKAGDWLLGLRWDDPAWAIIKSGKARGMSPQGRARRLVAKADASTGTLNDHPDSDFAYIEPGGTKDESGKTTPRSLRHFPIYDAAHTRNALARAPQSPFGDKAMAKIKAAAEKFGIDQDDS